MAKETKPTPSGWSLAEALLLRADLQKKLESLRARITSNAIVQDGDKPHEDPNKLLSEYNGVVDDLVNLVQAINRANLAAKVRDGRSLTTVLAERDGLKLRHAAITAAIGGTQRQPTMYGVKEIRWIATVKVASLQKQADDLARRIREINAMIQECNWKTTLERDKRDLG
jgi:hypothetical protein